MKDEGYRPRYPRCICGTPGHADDDPNEPKWNPECPVHTIGHYHKPGCCAVPQENMSPHRHMTKAEYDSEFPEVYDSIFTVGDSRYRLEARRFWDGIGATFTQLFKDENDGGLCFDFSGEVVVPLIEHLRELAKAIE